MNIVEFKSPPPIGTLLWLDTQVFELVDVVDHRRADGSASNILRWQAECPDCGLGFEATSGLVSKSLNRRCSACAKPLKPVSGRRKRGVKVRIQFP